MLKRTMNVVVLLGVFGLGLLSFNSEAFASNRDSSFSGGGPGVNLQKEERKQEEEVKENEFGWIQEKSTSKWWYKNHDGTYPKNSWVWLDGDKNGLYECYYFDNEGWMLGNTTTPDGYKVDEDGAWTENGQVERRTEEELKNPKVEEAKSEEEKPKAEEDTSSTSTDPTVPIPIPEPKEVEEQDYSKPKDFIKGGLVISGNKSEEDSIGGFISDSEFEKIAQYARDKGFTTEYKSHDGEQIDGKLLLIYRMTRKYIPNDPSPNMARVNGRIYNGDKYVEIYLWMDEGNNYGTYTVRFYNGSGFTYRERAMHTKAYSIAEMKEAIDYAANHSILRN